MNILVLDTETTGVSSETDEILQISMTDGKGQTLINEYVKPTHTESWEGAMEVNHITPEMVADKNTFDSYKDFVQEKINEADLIVGYNQQFDCKFLSAVGVVIPESKKQFDVMRVFSPIYAEKADKPCSWNNTPFKFKKLVFTAEYFGYKFKAHDSLEDVKATLFVYNKINTPVKRFFCRVLNPIRKRKMLSKQAAGDHKQ